MACRRILEGIVTTLNPDGSTSLSPMGPYVAEDFSSFTFRPYPKSTTYKNLKRTGQGVFHITDDVLLIAQAAVNQLKICPAVKIFPTMQTPVLLDACRWYGFKVLSSNETTLPYEIEAKVFQQGRFRDFLGFNRAKHAVLEAAILASRLDYLTQEKILSDLTSLKVSVKKTGGEQELQAFDFLVDYIHSYYAQKNNASPSNI